MGAASSRLARKHQFGFVDDILMPLTAWLHSIYLSLELFGALLCRPQNTSFYGICERTPRVGIQLVSRAVRDISNDYSKRESSDPWYCLPPNFRSPLIEKHLGPTVQPLPLHDSPHGYDTYSCCRFARFRRQVE